MAYKVTPAWTAISMVENQVKAMRQRVFNPISALEIQYMEVLNTILNKPYWWDQMEDSEILSQWMEEIDEQLRSQYIEEVIPYLDDMVILLDEDVYLKLSDCQAFLMDELRDLSARMQSTFGPVISPTTAHGVFFSDQIIPWSLNDAVKHLSSLLTADLGDVRQSGNGQVLDLIDPSLYCLRFDDTMMSTKPLRAFGEKSIPNNYAQDEPSISKKYAWLPSEFAVDEGKVRIRSYINNLNPRRYWNMYPVIAQVFEHILPMFNMTMESVNARNFDIYLWYSSLRISVDERNLIQSREDYVDMLWASYQADYNENSDRVDDDFKFQWKRQEYDRLDNNLDDDPRPVSIPTFGSYEPERSYIVYPDTIDPKENKHQNLQVIVKMSTIELTPENPCFEGGSWQMEGMVNEAILATAIYYYDIENITESRLSFRHIFDPVNLYYEHNEHRGVEVVYGFKNEVSDNVQPSGFILAEQNCCVVFPSCHHYRVEPFELADMTKNGHRKILSFFLVDPSVRIPSTMFVPPQQKEEVHRILRHCLPRKLHDDLLVIILSFVPGLLAKEEAVHHAHELLEERKISDREGYPGVSQIRLM
jgi:hypothetical protein